MTTTAQTTLLLTRREAARMLSLSERTIFTLTNRGELPSVKIGACVRYALADLQAYVSRKREQAAA